MKNKIAELAQVVEVNVPIQSVIINGQEQQVMGKVCVLVCPECGQPIQQFQPGVKVLDVLKHLNTDDEEKLKSTVYCKRCGQKLKIMRPSPIEVEGIVMEDNIDEKSVLENNG